MKKERRETHPSAKTPSIQLQVHETNERVGWFLSLLFCG